MTSQTFISSYFLKNFDLKYLENRKELFQKFKKLLSAFLKFYQLNLFKKMKIKNSYLRNATALAESATSPPPDPKRV